MKGTITAERAGRAILPALNLKQGLLLVSVFCLSLAVKQFYSTAQADDLRWLLAPLAFLTHLLTGMTFTFSPAQGYTALREGIIIAPACCGLNFLLITFCMLAIQGIFANLPRRRRIFWLLSAPALAYIATLIINTLRIIIAIYLYQNTISLWFLTPERLHRLAGILLYYPALLGIFYITRQRLRNISNKGNSPRALLLLPFCCYIAVTLGIPILRAESFSATFREHCLTVLLTAGIVTLLFALKGTLKGTRSRKRQSPRKSQKATVPRF